MKIEGLKNKEAIEVGDNLLVELGSSNYAVDGVEVTSQWGQVLINKGSELCSVKPSYTKISHYELNGEKMDIDTYKATKQDLLGHYDADYDEYSYDNLDHEYECKKKLEALGEWIPIKVKIERVLTPIDLKIVGTMEETGSPFIESAIKIGQSCYQEGMYKCLISKATKDKWEKLSHKYGSLSSIFTNSNHSNIRFAQINGKYLFKDDWPFTEKLFRITKTLKEAKDCISTVTGILEEIVMNELEPKPIETTTAIGILSDLKLLSPKLYGIRKTKTKNEAEDILSKVIDKLNKIK